MKLNKLMIALVVMMSSFAASAQVAKIGDASYATLTEAIAEATAGQTIKLVADLSVDTETYTIGAGKSVVLDMNGKTITVTDNKQGTSSAANYELFYIVDGNLTVTGNGTIKLTSTHNRAWNAMSAIFHNRGGVLTIENGTFKNLGGTDMAYVVDNSGNHYGDATTNIYDGTLYSTYTAIRNRMEQNTHGASGKVYLNIYGGNINGGTSAVWAQAASTSTTAPATGEINISGGQVGLVNTARSAGAESMTTITGGTVDGFKGEVGELTVNGGTITGAVTILTSAGDVVDYTVDENGVYVEKVELPVIAKVGATEFTDIYEAFKAANGKVVTILQNLELTQPIVIGANKKIEVQAGDGSKTISFVNEGKGFHLWYGAALTLAEGLTIEGAGENVSPIYIEDATLVSAANITTTSENASAPIFAERSANVTIKGGTVKAEGAATAINWTSVGTLTVNDGVVQGVNAINLKSGMLAITGGEFNGVEAAVAIETNGGDYPVAAVAISGGTFTSETTDVVVSTSSDINVGAMSNFITGGTFSSNVESLVALGYKGVDNGDGTYSVVRDESQTYVAQIGAKYYVSFSEAIEALTSTSEELVLLEDITLTEMVQLEKNGVTLNLNGHTVTANCRKAFEVHGGATIKNGTILSENRCVDTRNAVNLVLENLNLKGTSTKHGNPQPITIGGSAHGTNVDMSNVSVDFAANCPGYSIISFVKTNLTATECKFTNAYNVLYAREDNASNSVFTFNNCNMYAKTPAYHESNWFSLIAIRANNVTVNVNGCLLHGEGQVSALSLHGLNGSQSGFVYSENCTIKLSAETEVIGDMILESNENFSKNTIILPATEAYINKLTEENFLVIYNSDDTVTPTKNLDLVDGDFAYTNKADLEGMEISYKRTFANAGVWNAVFLPFEVPLSEDFLNKYKVAEWTNVNYTLNGSVLEGMSLELTLIKDPTAVLQANKPYFIYVKDAKDLEFNVSLTDATLYGALDDAANKVNFTFDGVMTCTMSGNYETLYESEIANDDTWVVSASGTWVHAKKMKPFRVKLVRTFADGITVSPVAKAMRVFIRDLDEGTTEIEGVETESEQAASTYDLQGRRVMDTAKSGIYIVNGKKVVVK